MKRQEWIFLGLFGLGSVFTTLSTVEYGRAFGSIHTERPLQMSRIDTDMGLSPGCVGEIKRSMRPLAGIDHVYVNAEDGVMVFSHDPKIIDGAYVMAHLRSELDLPFKEFQPEEGAPQGCPITGPSSFPMKVGAAIWTIIH